MTEKNKIYTVAVFLGDALNQALHVPGRSYNASYSYGNNERDHYCASLIEAGAEIRMIKNNSHEDREHPLHACAYDSLNKSLEALIARGVPIDIEDANKKTALFYAIEYCNFDAIKILIQHGANVNHISDTCATPLHLLAYKNNDHHFYSSRSDVVKSTKYNDVLKFLIAHNADINTITRPFYSKDKTLYTALDIAKECKNKTFANIMEQELIKRIVRNNTVLQRDITVPKRIQLKKPPRP